MENEDVIRHQMEETRTSLTEKLETLENKVVETVQEATSAVSETVASVKGTVQDTVATVQSAVTSVQDTVGSVKDSMKEGVTAVKETVQDMFDISGHMERHPWAMMGGSMAVGFCLGNIFSKKELDTTKMAEAAPAVASSGHVSRSHSHGNGGPREKRRAEASKAPAMGLLSDLAPEINRLKSLALGALMGTVREMIIQALPEKMGGQLKEIINSVTEKVGGSPIPSSDWAGSQHKNPSQEEAQRSFQGEGSHRQTSMGGFDR